MKTRNWSHSSQHRPHCKKLTASGPEVEMAEVLVTVLAMVME
jgi:hypothetical protein